MGLNLGSITKAIGNAAPDLASKAGNVLGGGSSSAVNSNTRNEMFQKVCTFIPKHVNNDTVVGAFELMRAQQKMVKKDFSTHKASNESAFKKHESTITKASGFIEDQNNYADMAFGDSTMKYSGCEIFATYNAIYSIKKRNTISLSDMIADYEKDGMVFSGKFGTAPKAIADYLTKNGFKTEFCTKEADFDALGKRSASLILTMYNNKEDLSKEVHTINISKNGEQYIAHNVHCNGKVIGPYASVSELIANLNGGQAKGISLIGIN